MKKKLALILIGFLVLSNHNLFSQADHLSVFDRHNGIIMERALALEFDESTKLFYYNKDDHNDQKHLEVRNYDLYNIKGTDNGKYILSIKFYNPLRIKFTFDETKIADPSIEDINNFIDKIPGDLYGLNKTFQTKNQTEVTVQNATFSYNFEDFDYAPDVNFNIQGNSNIQRDTTYQVPTSMISSQWLYEFYQKVNFVKFTSESEKKDGGVYNLIKNLKAADDYLYNEITFTENQDSIRKSLSDWIEEIQTNLYNQVSRQDFKRELERTNAILKEIKKAKTKAETSLDNFFLLITDKYTDKIAPLLGAGELLTDQFRDYSIAASQWIRITIAERKKLNDEALKKLDEFVTKLNDFYNLFSSDGYKTLQTSQIDHKEAKIKEVTVSAVKLEKNGQEISDSKKTNIFRIARWNSAYPYISAGGFFTNFTFPEYNLDLNPAGATIINSSEKKVRYAPSLFLNIVFNWHNQYVYPIMQLGIGTVENSILMPLGLGISLLDRVTISGGIVPGFTKQLNQLSVGDPVTSQADLDKDLTYKLMSTGYFGININLNK